jgi:hypothetical protein
MFLLRNTQRVSKRDYAVAASAASFEVGFDNRVPKTFVVRWASDDSAREMETIERDGRRIPVPRYGEAVDAEVTTPATIGHAPERSSSSSRLSLRPSRLSPRCPCGPVPRHRRRWSRLCTRPMRRRRELCRHALDDDSRWQAHRLRASVAPPSSLSCPAWRQGE